MFVLFVSLFVCFTIEIVADVVVAAVVVASASVVVVVDYCCCRITVLKDTLLEGQEETKRGGTWSGRHTGTHTHTRHNEKK